MSYPQPPYRPGLQQPESNGVPFPPSARVHPSQTAQQPRLPFAPQSPAGSRPGSAARQHSGSPGLASPMRQDYRSSSASSSRSNVRPGAPASPSRPDYNRASSSSRGPPLSPAHTHARVTSHDATSPLKQATTSTAFQEVPLQQPQSGPWVPPNRTPTLPAIDLEPTSRAAPTTHSRFSGMSTNDRFQAASDMGTWPRLAQWTLLPLILVMSGAVTILLGHSLSLYGGLKIAGTIDYSVSTHPVWPSDLSLLPTWMLLAVGFTSFCCSIIMWGYSLRVRFMKPVSWVPNFRFCAGVFFVAAWIGSLVVYKLFEARGEGSLESYACKHKADNIVGVEEIARVCTEQSTGFGLAITTAILEIGLIVCFVMRRKNEADTLSEKQLGKSQA